MAEEQDRPGTPDGGGKERDDALIRAARDAARKTPPAGLRPPTETDEIPPSGFFPGYDVVREIHRGGQGVVYLAVQRTTKRKVAIKAMRETALAAGSRGRARFDREVEILGQLQHPNIVGVIDSGETSGLFYYVMDYISGQTLDVWIAAGEHGVGEALRLFVKIADAVNAAHLRGVIHRDLKPSNISIDSAGEPHILDFGLAKVLTGEASGKTHLEPMTLTGQFLGSLPWASPEQAEGAPDKIDVRTDVYSLGVVLYQMLTGGKFPYSVVGNMRDVLDNILRAAPARPSTIRRQINDEVETIVLKALAKERERRYQSAGELARDVRRYLSGEPIEAKRDSAWYVITKTLRRRKWQAAGALGALVAIIAFGVVSTTLWRRAAAAEAEAIVNLRAAEAAQAAEAAERARAEANFDAVRGLARVFLFDFSEDISDLRGATAAREHVLREARRYLDQVRPADVGGGDPAFLREWADANERAAALLAGWGSSSAGGAEEAAAMAREARAVRSALLERAPNDPRAMADMARSEHAEGRLLAAAGDEEGALAAYSRASALRARAAGLLRERPDEVSAALRARIERDALETTVREGDALATQGRNEADEDEAGLMAISAATGRYEDAARGWSALLRADPDDAEAAQGLSQAQASLSNALLLKGRTHMDPAREATKVGDAGLASEEWSLARAEYVRARDVADAAAESFARLAESHPANAALQRGVIVSLHNAGEAEMWVARALAEEGRAGDSRAAHEAALARFERALGLAERLAASDESNLRARRDLALCLNKVGNQRRAIEDLDGAMEIFRRSLSVREDLLATDATPQARMDLAVAIYKIGETLKVRAEGAAGDARRADVEEAVGWFDRAEAAFLALAAEGVLPENATQINRVRRDRDECRALAPLEGQEAPED